jgi:glycolate oxidase iron-sulfur subunit
MAGPGGAPRPGDGPPAAPGSLLDPAGRLAAAASDCVHCGFCLPACPTYQLWGEEMDSPRGRIHLISQVLGGSPVTESVVTHLDRCLGCLACLPACPSGVRYHELIEAARTWTEEPPPGLSPPPPARSRRERALRAAVFATFPYPGRLQALAGPLRLAQRAGLNRLVLRSPAMRRLAPQFTTALRLAPPAPAGPGRQAALPSRIPARGPRRAVVGLLTGCVQRVFFPQVNAATARVLAAEGCDVIVPPGQGCCGALSLHGGRHSQAVSFARRTIAVFERAGVDAVVVNAAGCGSAMKEYPGLLAGEAGWPDRAAAFSRRVRDFSEFLAGLYQEQGGPRAARHELAITAVYHDACHLGHAQRIRRQPRELLRGIPGLVLAEAGDGGGGCCGSAGVYNLLQPQAAAELGQRKAATLRATGASLVVSPNPGCTLQLSAALEGSLAVVHPAEVLDASFRGVPASLLAAGPGPRR